MALYKLAIEQDGKMAMGTEDGTFPEESPKLKRIANILGIVLGKDFKADEPEQHLHLHEDKASVQYRQRA